MRHAHRTRLFIPLLLLLALLSACFQQPSQPAQDVPPPQAEDTEHDVPALPSQGEPTNADTLKNELEVRTQDVEYLQGTTGYLAEPVQEGNYPGIVMMHEWWGLNNNIKEMAKALASQGYTVLAVDLYKGEVASTPEEARTLVGAFDQDEGIANMQAAARFLEQRGAQRLASLGWCFGGKQSLQLSLSRPLDATIIYYGQLELDSERLKSLNGPVLGIFGSDDTSIPPEAVNAFEDALATAGIDNNINIYDGVGHAFANPSGSNYAPDETQDAWNKTLDFLRSTLKPPQDI